MTYPRRRIATLRRSPKSGGIDPLAPRQVVDRFSRPTSIRGGLRTDAVLAGQLFNGPGQLQPDRALPGNYAFVVEGGLEKDSWFVVDFSAVKKLMRRLTDELDHRVLLPRDNPKLTISEENGSVRVAFDGQPRYVFPARDCVILPIPNTTVEMLSQYLAGRVRAELGSLHLKAIEVEVEENFGQSASYRDTFD